MLYLIAFIFGSVMGSFLCLAAGRVPQGLSVISPPSHCDQCGKSLAARDLIPIISFLALKGRCRYCQVRISPVAPFCEGLAGVSLCLAIYQYGLNLYAFYIWLLCLMGITLSVTDIFFLIAEPRLFYAFCLPLLMLAGHWGFFRDLSFACERMLGALTLLFLLLFLQRILPNALGGGDLRILVVWAFFLGLEDVIWIILCASFLGILYFLIKKHQRKHQLAFVPFLTIGLFLVLFLL